MLNFIPISYGFIIGGTGLALFTIGGLIQLANNPSKFDEEMEWMVREFEKNPLGSYRFGVDILDPKVLWWCIPGIVGCVAGAAIFFLR